MSRRHTYLLALTVLLVPAIAQPIAVVDPGSSFRVDIAAAGARACVSYPRASRDEAQCRNLGIPSAELVEMQSARYPDAPIIAQVLLVSSEWQLPVVVTRNRNRTHSEWSATSVPATIAGYRRAVASDMAGAARLLAQDANSYPFVRDIDGIEVIEHVMEFDVLDPVGNPRPSHVLVAHIVGRDAIVTVWFSMTSETQALLTPIAERILRSVSIQPALNLRRAANMRALRLVLAIACAAGSVVAAMKLRALRKKPVSGDAAT